MQKSEFEDFRHKVITCQGSTLRPVWSVTERLKAYRVNGEEYNRAQAIVTAVNYLKQYG